MCVVVDGVLKNIIKKRLQVHFWGQEFNAYVAVIENKEM